jgi:uncharacterized protein YfdQ (DUF2303 family)
MTSDVITKIEELVSASHEPTTPSAPQPHQGPPYVARPEGWQTVHVPEYPTRIVQRVNMDDPRAFAHYVGAFAQKGTLIFLDKKNLRYRAVLDYHQGGGGDESLESPRWCDHIVDYQAVTSPEWQTWSGNDKRAFTQVAFAEFLEDNQEYIAGPRRAELLETVKTLKARADVKCSTIRLEDGSTRLHFDESAKGRRVEIPCDIVLQIPVLDNGAFGSVTARLKYRLKDRQLLLWYELVRPQRALERQLATVTAEVEKVTGIAVLKGMPFSK